MAIKPVYKEWSSAEMFACLKNNHVIHNSEKLSHWESKSEEMEVMLEEFFEL